MKLIYIVAMVVSLARGAEAPKKIYLEQRQKGNRNVTLELTREIMKRCPGAISITEEKASADFRLGIASKASTLYRASGEAEHVFSAKWTVSGLSKEVCAYVESR